MACVNSCESCEIIAVGAVVNAANESSSTVTPMLFVEEKPAQNDRPEATPYDADLTHKNLRRNRRREKRKTPKTKTRHWPTPANSPLNAAR